MWATPVGLVGYLCSLVSAWLVVAAVALVGTPAHKADVAVYAALLVGAAVCVEATRRLGEAAGVVRDLQTVWTVPIALLLPPVYGLLAPIPLKALGQWRLGRGLIYRRVLTVAAIGLAHYTASVVFHRLAPIRGVESPLAASPGRTVLLGLGCAAVCYLINTGLIAVAVRLASPELGWRQLIGDREALFIDLVEVCLGVVVFAAWTVTPLLAVVLLPPAVLLQRCLTHAQLRAAARTDAKTGLLNAVSWQEEATREIVRAGRERQPLAILMVDVDHFKVFNERYGHVAGDQALIAVAGALAAGQRSYDLVGRFGGEEFTVLLPNADQANAHQAAERLRRRVAALVVPGTPQGRLTVSVGVALLSAHGRNITDLLTAADHALYRAKNAGRNQIAVAAVIPAPRPAPAGVPLNQGRPISRWARRQGVWVCPVPDDGIGRQVFQGRAVTGPVRRRKRTTDEQRELAAQWLARTGREVTPAAVEELESGTIWGR